MKWNRHFGFAVFTVVLVSASCEKSVEPIPLDFHNRILFTSQRSGKYQIYMMNPDGSGITKLTPDNYSNSEGVWSPNANKIIFNSEEQTYEETAMWIMNSDGSDRRLLTYGYSMSWSPDGQTVAFTHIPNLPLYRDYYLYTIRPDGSGWSQLTTTPGFVESVSCWSPNGMAVYLSSNRHDSTHLNFEIYSITLDSLKVTRITYTQNGFSHSHYFSPDGQLIAYVSSEGGINQPAIFIMNADGSNKHLVAKPPTGQVYHRPRWSPDGQIGRA